MIKITSTVVLLLVATLALAACGSGGGTNTSLEGSSWLLLAYRNSAGQMVSVLPDTQVTAEFKQGQITGSAGCNSYFGSFEVSGKELALGPIGMTEMYCFPEQLMAQEADYLAALGSAASYEIQAGRLVLRDDGGAPVADFTTADAASRQ